MGEGVKMPITREENATIMKFDTKLMLNKSKLKSYFKLLGCYWLPGDVNMKFGKRKNIF